MKWFGLVFLYNVCVVKCHSIAASELEDFSNYLRETSQLHNVKSSYPDIDYDEDEAVSDTAWEESGKFEGDLVLNERQRRLIVTNVAEGLARNGLTDTTKRWPNNEVIYYIQKEHFTNDQIQAIQDGIDDLARSSCVKFKAYEKGNKDAVVIQGSRRGCFSQVGYQGGYQVLNLSGRHPVGRGCFRHGTVVHELLHTLGFYHMQSSPDRDDYIDVIWENIVRPARHNFRKYNSFAVSDFGVGYDYESVLHYSRKAFSSNGLDTVVPKQLGADIGQRIGLSQKDIQKLNKMYCDADGDLLDENSEVLKKPAQKKKGKNSPFQGHGLGYEQGKTVIIKLPTNQQNQMTHSQQTMFDYFSSTPKTVPETTFVQGFRTGKEINTNLDLHSFSQAQAESTKPTSIYNPTNIQNYENWGQSEIEIHTTEKNQDSSYDKDLNEAFDRLAKISGANFYPTKSTIFDYDYNKFINPKKDIVEELQMTTRDKFILSDAPKTTENENNRYDIPYKAETFLNFEQEGNSDETKWYEPNIRTNPLEYIKEVKNMEKEQFTTLPKNNNYNDEYYHKPNVSIIKYIIPNSDMNSNGPSRNHNMNRELNSSSYNLRNEFVLNQDPYYKIISPSTPKEHTRPSHGDPSTYRSKYYNFSKDYR